MNKIGTHSQDSSVEEKTLAVPSKYEDSGSTQANESPAQSVALSERNNSLDQNVERQKNSIQKLSSHTKEQEKDPNVIEWDGPDDPVIFLSNTSFSCSSCKE